MKLDNKGLLIVLSGPSGVGKGTVREALFQRPDHNLVFSVSMTTRAPREGEVDGREYYFVSNETFEQNIKDGKMLEYASFVGNYYGTPLDAVNRELEKGNEVVLEIEVQGALQVREKCNDAIFIFIAPPTIDALYKRLRKRGTDSEEIIRQRVEKAQKELTLAYKYDYIVVNDDVDNAADRIMAIIRAEHAKTERCIHEYRKIIGGTNNEN